MRAELNLTVQDEILKALTSLTDQNLLDSPAIVILLSGVISLITLFLSNRHNEKINRQNLSSARKTIELEAKIRTREMVNAEKIKALKILYSIDLKLTPTNWNDPNTDTHSVNFELTQNFNEVIDKLVSFLDRHGYILSSKSNRNIYKIINLCNENKFQDISLSDYENMNIPASKIKAAGDVLKLSAKVVKSLKLETGILDSY